MNDKDNKYLGLESVVEHTANGEFSITTQPVYDVDMSDICDSMSTEEIALSRTVTPKINRLLLRHLVDKTKNQEK